MSKMFPDKVLDIWFIFSGNPNVLYLSDFSDVGKCMQDCGILQKSEIMFGKSYQ